MLSKRSTKKLGKAQSSEGDGERKLSLAKPVDGKLDVSGWGLRSLEGLLPSTRVEALYCRANHLRNLNGLPVLPKLHVLDASTNSIIDVSGLNSSPLRMLFLAANNIQDVSSIPSIPTLEVLSLSHNKLESLEGMQTQPALKVLSLSSNRLESIKGFPVFPCLESLRVAENPLCSSPHYRVAAACACGPSLQQVDGEPVPPQAEQQPARVGVAVRQGMTVKSMDSADIDAEEFLAQTAQEVLRPCVLEGGRIAGDAMEGCVLTADARLSFEGKPLFEAGMYHGDEEHAGYVQFQWHRARRNGVIEDIEGATHRSWTAGIDDVDGSLVCSVLATLSDGTVLGPALLVSTTVQAAPPSVHAVGLEGSAVEGNRLTVVADYVGGREGNSNIRWYARREEDAALELLVEGAQSLPIGLDLIGARVVVEYTPVRDDGAIGASASAESAVVQAARPQISDLRIKGAVVEGELLHGIGNYFGGTEGSSIFQWYRGATPQGPFVPIPSATMSSYTPATDDIGQVLRFEYTPVSTRGVVGSPATVVSSTVMAGLPVLRRLAVLGNLEESSELLADAEYFGGIEGKSEIQWYRRGAAADAPDTWAAIPGANQAAYLPTADDVQCYLRVSYRPVRSDGTAGQVVYAVSQAPIHACTPRIDHLRIEGDVCEGGTLRATFSYRGGREGNSRALWQRIVEGVAEDAGSGLEYTPVAADTGYRLRFLYLPTRDDGVSGASTGVDTDVVAPGPPQVRLLELVGRFEQGETIAVKRTYTGGHEGASRFRWLRFRDGDGGAVTEEVQCASADVYTLSAADVDCILALEYLPVRDDGVTGPGVVARTPTRIEAAPPELRSGSVEGEPLEGCVQEVMYEYYGGIEGPTVIVWHRQRAEDSSAQWQSAGSGKQYTPTNLDVGCKLRATVTPIRQDGARGPSMSFTTTQAIEPGMPDVQNLSLAQLVEENVELNPAGTYFGAEPGVQRKSWIRIYPDGREMVVASTHTYTPNQEDIGCQLRFEWIPQRSDGVVGPTATVTTAPVIPGIPVASNITITRTDNADLVASATYRGGIEGASVWQWQRIGVEGIPEAIEGANSKMYTPVPADTGFAIRAVYTPVRHDGVAGKEARSEPTARLNFKDIRSIDSVSLSGTYVEGQTVSVAVTGFSKTLVYQWYRKPAGAQAFSLIASARRETYQLALADVGCVIKVDVVPIFRDMQGRPASAETPVVEAALPEFRSPKLSVSRSGFHDTQFSFTGTYFGGVASVPRIRWLRARKDGDFEEIPGATGPTYEASIDDVGYRIRVEYTPIRNDGVTGKLLTETFDEEIQMKEDLKRHVEGLSKAKEIMFEVKQVGTDTKSSTVEARTILLNKDKIKIRVPKSTKTLVKESYNPRTRVYINPMHKTHFALDLNAEKTLQFTAATPQDRNAICVLIRQFVEQAKNTKAYQKLAAAQKTLKSSKRASAVPDMSWMTADMDAAGPAPRQ